MSYPQVDPTIADIDSRIHALEIAETGPPLVARVAALEEANETLVTQVDGLAATANDVSATLNAHGGRLTDVETGLTSHGAQITSVARDLQLLNDNTGSSLGGLSSDLSSAEEAIASLTSRVTMLESSPPGTGAAWSGTMMLPQFSGVDSTAKLRTALQYVATATDGRKPAIVIPPGTVLAPGTTPFMLPSGTALLGGTTPETEFSPNSRVTISGAAPNGAFDHANDARSITIANIGWEGPGLSQVCRFFGDGSNRLCYSLFSGVSFDNFTSVLRKRFLGFLWQGSGYCNNAKETPFEFSGSDYKVFMDGYYLDSPNLKDSDYLIHIKSGNKVVVGEVFVTGQGPTPVRVSGGQAVRLRGLEMEAGDTAVRKIAGAGLLVTGGNVIVDNLFIRNTLWNPTSPDLVAAGRNDRGVIHVEGNGTMVRVKHATFGEYNVTPERPGGHVENHVYVGGSAQVYLDGCKPWNMQANSGVGGTQNARPLQVQKTGTGAAFATTYAAL